MDRLEDIAELIEDAGRPVQWHGHALAEQLIDRLTLDIFHHDVGEILLGQFRIVNADGIRMSDLSHHHRFSLEARAGAAVVNNPGHDQLHGPKRFDLMIADQPDLTHATLAEQATELIAIGNDLPRSEHGPIPYRSGR